MIFLKLKQLIEMSTHIRYSHTELKTTRDTLEKEKTKNAVLKNVIEDCNKEIIKYKNKLKQSTKNLKSKDKVVFNLESNILNQSDIK